jgi:hypothetical protein
MLVNMKNSFYSLLVLFLFSFCQKFNYSPCDPSSENFRNMFLLRNLSKDTTPYCGIKFYTTTSNQTNTSNPSNPTTSPTPSNPTDWLNFNPSTISTLRFWIRAESIGQGNNTAVNTWTDLSGSGNSITLGAAPTFFTLANQINGRPVVKFLQASSQYLTKVTATGVNLTNSGSTFIVMRKTSSLDMLNILFIGGSCNGGRQFSYSTSLTRFEMNRHCDGQVAQVNAFAWSIGEVKQISILQLLSTNITFRSNGIELLNTTPLISTAYSTGVINVNSSNNIGNHSDMEIAEILFYSDRISDQDVNSVECYLGARYGTRTCN